MEDGDKIPDKAAWRGGYACPSKRVLPQVWAAEMKKKELEVRRLTEEATLLIHGVFHGGAKLLTTCVSPPGETAG